MADSTDTRCPRCTGRLLHERDRFSHYVNCLLCGYVRESLQLDLATARLEANLDGREEPRLRALSRAPSRRLEIAS